MWQIAAEPMSMLPTICWRASEEAKQTPKQAPKSKTRRQCETTQKMTLFPLHLISSIFVSLFASYSLYLIISGHLPPFSRTIKGSCKRQLNDAWKRVSGCGVEWWFLKRVAGRAFAEFGKRARTWTRDSGDGTVRL